ncbi:MAG: T9SS type A sorting domain-containing protein [Bacteroidetes bacterium]|nr:T9SS type A sorting domain-containing protein [Bacteroidota bacterium]
MKNVTKLLTKLTMLLALTTMFFQQVGRADNFVQIGTYMGLDAAYNIPFDGYYYNSRTQYVYLASEMAPLVAGTINKIGFQFYNNGGGYLNPCYIKMKNSAATTLSTFDNSGFTTVWSGNYNPPASGWMTTTLTTPFVWNGTSNIIVEICFESSAWGSYTYNYHTAHAGGCVGQQQDAGPGCSFAAPFTLDFRANVQFTQTLQGNLTGTVRNCNTTATMANVSVSCGGVGPVLTNGSGVYTLNAIPAGNQTITATATGMTPYSASVNVVPNVTTTYNFCMFPLPGIISGIVTNAATTLPVVGAKITWGAYTTYSVAGGLYSLNVYVAGPYNLQATKEGFDLFQLNNVTVTVPSPPTTVANIALSENTPAPSPIAPSTTMFKAELNAAQTAVNLTWGLPLNDMVLIYDDGIQDNFVIWATGGGNNMNAMKFTPISYPTIIKGFYLNIGQAGNYPAGANPFSPVQMAIYNEVGGLPGAQLAAPTTYTPGPAYGWNRADFTAPVTITSGNFYIVMIQMGNSSASPGLAIDTTVQQMRSYSNFNNTGWVPGPGNYMIRAVVNGSGGPLLSDAPGSARVTASAVPGLIYETKPATVTGFEGSPKGYSDNYSPDNLLGYQVWRLLQTQEANPLLWTSLNTTTNTNYTDNGWPSVQPPCGPFRWAVKAQYTFNRWSNAIFSNVIGKCWTCNVTVNVDLSCDSANIQGAVVKLQNLDLQPQGIDTSYTHIMDNTGTWTFTNFWKGNYSLVVTKFGYVTYTQTPIAIFGDLTINVTLLQIKAAPTGLHVNDSTLFANWFPPMYEEVKFVENFESGSFATNGWVADAGSYWAVNAYDGNPGQCAEWYWTADVTNYSQSLTSKTFAPTYAPVMKLRFDVFLYTYGNTNLNQLAAEIWDGTSWTSVANFDNSSGGNIPYTTVERDITPYANSSFKVRFRAYGVDAVDISYWDIDNVKIVAQTVVDPNPCVIGYNFYLNNILNGFTPDTFYNIPPTSVQYGTPYHACVLAIYGSGYSAQNCFDFTSHFLCPPHDLAVQGIESTAYLTWAKPNCGGCTLATYQFETGTVDNGFSYGAGSGAVYLGNFFPVTPATTTGVIKSFDCYFMSTAGTTSAQSCIMYLYDAAHNPIGQSLPFINTGAAYPGGTWVNVPINDIPYTGSFYAMIDYYVAAAPRKNWLACQYIAPAGYPSGLGYVLQNGVWSLVGPANGFPIVTFIQRANVCVNGKDKSAPITTIDPTGQIQSPIVASTQNLAVTMGTVASVPAGEPNAVSSPDAPSAVTLLGYRIFRNNVYQLTINNPNTLEYYDNYLDPGSYCYKVDAWYNVAPYVPALDNSQPDGPQCVTIAYGYPLPFFEPWDQATFTYQKWSLPAGQLNWSINTALGNPLPCADFSWQPMTTNYDLALTSPAIDASAWTCADIFLDVDIKLVDRNATSAEILDVDIKVNGNWINKASFTNSGSMDWTLKHMDISSVKGKAFQIRFRAHGANSADILHWYVDNIHAYGVCKAPTTLTGVQNQFTTTLTWVAPVCGHGGPTPQWIHWDDGTYYAGFGYNGAYTWQIAARWTPVQLAPLDGGAVTKIKFWPNSQSGSGSPTFRLRIWEGPMAATMVVDQAVASVTFDAWNEIALTTPHPINIGAEMWVGLEIVQAAGGYPAGIDAGPAVDNYGDWWYDGTTWATIFSIGNDYNWNLQAYVEPGKKDASSAPIVLTQLPINNPKGMLPRMGSINTTNKNTSSNTGTGRIAPLSPMGSQLMGYNIYRTDDNTTSPFNKIGGPVQSLTYADVHPSTTEPTTTWKYYVTSVFQDSLHPGPILCEGLSDTITITFPAVGINDLTNSGLMIYPNPANEVVNVSSTSDIKTIEVHNFIGQMIYSNNNVNLKKVELNVSTFKTGVYFVKVTTATGTRTTKVTVTH